jgi:hypothetical protein
MVVRSATGFFLDALFLKVAAEIKAWENSHSE